LDKFEELIEAMQTPKLQPYQTQLLRQLIDAAALSSSPPKHGFYKPLYEIEVDFE